MNTQQQQPGQNMLQQLQQLQQQSSQNGQFVRRGVPGVGHVNLDRSLASPGSLFKDRAVEGGPVAGQGRTKRLKKNIRKTRRRKTLRLRRK
jgi:hypothetical protein